MLQDISGNVLSMTTNEAGNFWTFAQIASNPKAVASHSGTTTPLFSYDADGNLIPADPADSRTWQYKAWVKNTDGAVRQMVTIAPIGGATGTSPRMSCNMHHSPFGSTGAAWSSRKSSLASYPATSLSFKSTFFPSSSASALPATFPVPRMTRLVTESDTLDPSTSIDYSSGQDLTSYSGSTVCVVSGNGVTKTGIKDVTHPYMADPDTSPVLLKTKIQPDGSAIHPGGTFWTADDADYKAIRQWIAEGAPEN